MLDTLEMCSIAVEAASIELSFANSALHASPVPHFSIHNHSLEEARLDVACCAVLRSLIHVHVECEIGWQLDISVGF